MITVQRLAKRFALSRQQQRAAETTGKTAGDGRILHAVFWLAPARARPG